MRRFERKFHRYMDKNWGCILVGLWLTSKAIDTAYKFRGYKAFGSEFLVLPVFLITVGMIRNLINFARCQREER